MTTVNSSLPSLLPAIAAFFSRAEKHWKSRTLIFLASGCLVSLLLTTSARGQVDSTNSAITRASMTDALAAAEQGDIQAQVKVGRAYAEGTAGPRNYGEAVKWLQAASTQGSMEANAWLGNMYLLGHGVQRDVAHGANLIQAAADANSPAGLRFTGLMYETGQGIARDYSQAVAFYTRGMAQQDASSTDHLGVLYLHGLGVRRDIAKAFTLFTQAAGLGDNWAQLHLGQMYQSGFIPNPVMGISEAASSKSSKNSHSSKVFKTNPDYASALKFYTAAAAQRNRVATYKLGVLYENGLGVGQDYGKALEYYSQAASQKFTPALIAFGRMHELGLGTNVNLPYAYLGYSLAAGAGDPTAAQHLRSLLVKLSPDELQSAQALLKTVRQRAPLPTQNDN